MLITNETMGEALGRDVQVPFECETLGLINSKVESTLSFLDEKKFILQLKTNENIKVVIVNEELLSSVGETGKIIIPSDDARYEFYVLQNFLAKKRYTKRETLISSSSSIHPSAYVADNNVVIGDNVIVEPNVTILPDVEIGIGCILRAGSTIGCEGFEHKRTSRGILSVIHDGMVKIGNNVEIGSGSCISKGFFFRNTILGDYTKTDNLVHVAHGVQIGEACFLAASAMIAGGVTIGNNVWIGPGVSVTSGIEIGDSANITIGSVVVSSVDKGSHLSGNFAIEHKKFIRNHIRDKMS